jgi:quinol monooxygenase YgiN
MAGPRHILSSRGVIQVIDQSGRNDKEDEMSVTLLRQKVKDESVQEAEAAVHDLFATLERERPEGLRYASTRVADSSTFVILFELADGSVDPRSAIPEFARFLEQLKGWVDGPPVIETLDVVGSYNLFEDRQEVSAAG